MMKVLLINGSPNEKGCTFTALNEAAGSLSRNGIETEIFWIGRKAVNDCIACGGCMKLSRCVFGDDGVNTLSARADEFDGLIVGSPAYYAGPRGSLCSFLDRLFFSAGRKLQGKPAACVVSCRRGGSSAAFDRLNKYFTINNMPVVSSQYWNHVHGNSPEEVMQDAEGLQIMRTLGENMAYLLKCIDAGRKAGVPEPAREKHIFTNFIH